MRRVKGFDPHLAYVAKLVGINGREYYKGIEDEDRPQWLHYPIPVARKKL